ncbi:unnamed protein product [Owenia fusiformis]|uniref:Uncharacterized protein n=1 Tax=Owenia fusiformis TaxID=6347 RepID=A0A8J1U1I3_OWEFU|nr:unnamed protein product [Owenia fusiformis]
MARYRTELTIPIHKTDLTFAERQKNLWGDMEAEMERRRQEWEGEIDRMRQSFFKLKPYEAMRGSKENLIDLTEKKNQQSVFVDDKEGNPQFKVRFDVAGFKPEEINVRTQDKKLMVTAKHEETVEGSQTIKQFSRQVDIPSNVEATDLSSVLTNDGVLIIQAPLPAPGYAKLQISTPTKRLPTGGPVYVDADGIRKLRIVVDVGKDFNPEDVTVKTVDTKLLVSASKEEKSANRTMQRTFNKEYDMPESVDPFTINAFLDDDGKLTVEAPLTTYATPSPSPTTPTQKINISVRKFPLSP